MGTLCSVWCIPGDLQVVLFYCSAFCSACILKDPATEVLCFAEDDTANDDVSFTYEVMYIASVFLSKICVRISYADHIPSKLGVYLSQPATQDEDLQT